MAHRFGPGFAVASATAAGFASSIVFGLWVLIVGALTLAISFMPLGSRHGMSLLRLVALGVTIGGALYVALGLAIALFDGASSGGSGTS